MSTTKPRPLSDLRHDNGGAIMLTGLFMACFLIGSLWFVVGIGDTIVFRDRMQEATDHGAFASAALHAKGMNFIALCNLILLTAVTIHIILGIVHDIALAICIVSVGYGCGLWGAMRQVYTGYFKILKPAAKVIHVGEVVASYGYPVMGLVEGLQTGRKYEKGNSEVTVIPLSTSLLPGALARVAGASAIKKEGLPVESRPMNFLCRKIVYVGFDALFNKALGISGGSVGGDVIDMVKVIIGGVIEFRYCNDLGNSSSRLSQTKLNGQIGEGNGNVDTQNKKIDSANANRKPGEGMQSRITGAEQGSGSSSGGVDPGFDSFWGEDGPMVVYGAARNGNEWFQTWALNVGPRMDDPNEGKVALAGGPKVFAKYTKTEKPFGYVSQAEFYFDCDQGWFDDNCNRGIEENAAFQIKWRARLRKVAVPNLASMLGGMGLDILFNLKGYDKFKKLQGGFGKQAREIFGGTGVVGTTAIRTFTDFFARQAEIAAKNAVGDATKGLGPTLTGMYH